MVAATYIISALLAFFALLFFVDGRYLAGAMFLGGAVVNVFFGLRAYGIIFGATETK